ncbi:L-asparaginase 1 [bioreactor metagenome]|uniref:asparaginase n=1 Tax=bioreactor metagenome TaxID=1076179 RepID=A0A645JGE7_9ZZZZ
MAKAGVHIKYFRSYIHYPDIDTKLRVRTQIDQNVAVLKLFPGITRSTVHAILNISGIKAIILESFGAGNAPRLDWFFQELKEASERGILIINKSQCSTGTVEMGRYETSLNLVNAGVISGYDCTTEAIIAKLMCLLGECSSQAEIRHKLSISLCGEMTLG